MNIYFAEATDSDIAFFQRALGDQKVRFESGALAPEQISPEIEAISVMVHSQVTAAEMDRAPALKLILTRSTGFDHIDLPEAHKRGITVCNVPTYGSNTVAEHTFALLLSLSRKLHEAHRRALQGEFNLDRLLGFDLAGKTLGVVGAGLIGQHVIRIGVGFGMKVVAFDPYPKEQLSDLLRFQYVPLDGLLSLSDAVAVCAPLTDGTLHLFNRAAFAKMKRGSLLVNTARGPIVDTEALLWALKEGILDGAGLDVLEGEEMMEEDVLVSTMAAPVDTKNVTLIAENLTLMRHPNVIVTPHMAFYSREALQRIRETTLENFNAFAAGQPKNIV